MFSQSRTGRDLRVIQTERNYKDIILNFINTSYDISSFISYFQNVFFPFLKPF